MTGRPLATTAVLVTAAALVVSCGAFHTRSTQSVSPPPIVSASGSPRLPARQPVTDVVETAVPRAVVSDGRPRLARLSIPTLGLDDLAVVPYLGKTDDARGTRIQDGGVAASPYGPHGGVGPGGLGNYQVTAHRTSSTEAFRMLPSLRVGQLAIVASGGVRYIYEIRRTRETSFRSPRSLAEQRAAVPGRPGVSPRWAFLTLSTCATLEDHAQGNYWYDAFKNPEHRIDKIGVLVRTIVAN
jgi:sortase A